MFLNFENAVWNVGLFMTEISLIIHFSVLNIAYVLVLVLLKLSGVLDIFYHFLMSHWFTTAI